MGTILTAFCSEGVGTGLGIGVAVSPSDSRRVRTNYAGCHHDVEAAIAADNHGVLYLNSHVRFDDITDGPAQTILIGETIYDDPSALGWTSGTSATLRNTGHPPSDPNGTYALFKNTPQLSENERIAAVILSQQLIGRKVWTK